MSTDIVKICYEAHAMNADGDHIESGFCLRCAELYVALNKALTTASDDDAALAFYRRLQEEGPPA